MGGWTALRAAIEAPNRVRRLVLSNTPGGIRTEALEHAWRSVSKQRGGAFYEAGMTLDVPAGAVVVRVTTVPGDPVSTSVSARYPIEAGPVFAGPSMMGFGPASRTGKAPPAELPASMSLFP